MAKVKDWFWVWADRHMSRNPRSDWPGVDDPFWEGFRAILVKNGVSEFVADGASVAMMESPTPYLDRHIEAFMKQVKDIWARSEVSATAPNDRDAAARLSKDCDDCGGVGLAARFRRNSLAAMDEQRQLLDRYVVFYCRCALGRWIEKNHREKAQDVHRRIPDLERFSWLWEYNYRFPIGCEAFIEPTMTELREVPPPF